MGILAKFLRRQTGAVRYPEDMRVDGDRWFTEGRVQHHIGRLAAYARQCFQFRPGRRNLSLVLFEQPCC